MADHALRTPIAHMSGINPERQINRMDFPSKVIILLAFFALICIAGFQSDRIDDLRYENEKLKRSTRTQFKKKS